jgi:hypothetical protein
MPQIIGCVGLGFDIIGVLLLIKYGLPSSKALETGVFEAVSLEIRRKYDRYSRDALWLLFIGFLLQVVGNLMQIPMIAALLH